jgi:tetratricopeptide (TPR) repeat protein
LFRAILTVFAISCAFGQGSDYDDGVLRFQKGDLGGAVSLLNRAARQDSGNAQVWKALGSAYAAQKLYEQAESSFRRACELDPHLKDACYYHARSLYALDRFGPSLEVLQRAVAIDPTSCNIHLAIAQTLEALESEALERSGDAEKEYRRVVSFCGTRDRKAGEAFGRFLVRQGRFQEAIPILEEVLKEFPDFVEAHIQLGRVLLEQGQTDAAIFHLERAVALAPKSSQAHLLLAKAYARAGRAAEAQPHFELAAKYEQ